MKLKLWQVIMSVLAAFLGVQKDANRQRDFEQGNIFAYIIVGIIATILFVVGLIALVNFITTY